MPNLSSQLKSLPSSPGIYLFYNTTKELLYVGKATSLKNRVKSYFTGTNKSSRPIEELIHQVADIKFKTTDSVLEAIILESQYIKKYQPKYNVDGRDDKSWNYLVITKDEYPKLLPVRQHDLDNRSSNKNYSYIFGPFPSLNSTEIIKIFRKLFNLSTCKPHAAKPCFYYQLNQCLGVCTNQISSQNYNNKVIQPLIIFLRGHKKRLISSLKNQMSLASKNQDYEEAARLRDQIKNLRRIHDINLINKEFFKNLPTKRQPSINRIEGYDISNLGPTGKVGSMVVFNQYGPVKSAYRRFKIKTVQGQSDVGCLAEVLTRRFAHITPDWPAPDLILVDGGQPQLSAAHQVLKKHGLNFPVLGLAKGPSRKKNEFIFNKSNTRLSEYIDSNKSILIQVRDEAHRFAINYQRKLRLIK